MAIILSRMIIVLTQISIMLGLAVMLLDINIVGGLLSLYGMVILGTFIFLCIGFFLGSLAKTQEAIQPIAHALPLSVVVSGLRSITNDGMALLTFNFTTLGVGIWMVISFLVAIRFFVWKEIAT